MKPVHLSTDSWELSDVFVAEGFWDRFRGVKRLGRGISLLIQVRSVHTFGLKAPLRLVSVGKDLEVTEVKAVRPNRVAVFPGATYVVELAADVEGPAVGERMTISDG